MSNEHIDLAPVEYVVAGASVYARRHDFLLPEIDFRRVVADVEHSRRIAVSYMVAPSFDVAALPAFRAFRDETIRQFDFLTRPFGSGGLGVAVEVCPDDPYANAVAMTADLRERCLLKVFATAGSGNEHPFLTNDENDMFRAVHDAFGHASIGRGFDLHGEEAAWLKHSFMYSPLAQRALTTETRGQTCAFMLHFHGRQFAEQKLVLLPEEFSDIETVCIRDAGGAA